ncbi:MAG: hypothetical protein AAGI03_06235 [Pseudomonadota bacterium]
MDFKDLPFADALGPVALAGAAWFGAHYIFVAPELGQRLSDLEYRPACMTSVEALATERRTEKEAERRAIDTERRARIAEARERAAAMAQQAQGAGAAVDLIMSGPLGQLMAASTGDPNLRQTMKWMIPRVPEVDVEALDLPDLPAPLPEATPERRADYCGCISARSTDQERLAFTFYSSTLTAYAPSQVIGFEDVMAGLVQSGACGGLPGV